MSVFHILRPLLLLAASALCSAPWPALAEKKTKPLVPLPAKPPSTDGALVRDKISLGKQLFFDARLSGDNTLSCASCHLPEKAFADGLRQSRGTDGRLLARNTPALLNLAWQQRLFWDGRAKSLEEQALGPITAADEMNQDLAELERELAEIPGYASQFERLFGAPPSRAAVAAALAAFQRTLVAANSPLDRYLAGDKQALSPAAKRGMELFVGDAGCVRCHRGPLLADGEFYRLGIGHTDRGLAAVTGRDEDAGKFRTPTLRNIAETAPYMHDGSLATLTDVVTFYYRGVPATGSDDPPLDVQPLVGQSFSEIPDLVAFLESLSGELPAITPPELP